MPYFADAGEVHRYVGGIFRQAADHPEVGPKLRAADVVLRIVTTEPDADLTVRMCDDYEVIDGASEHAADVTLTLPGDIADRYWRGNYNLAVGLAKREVKAQGPVNKILKLVPLTKPLFPIYEELTADKQGAAA